VIRQELGKWIGRTEAFLLVANRCSAAQAECLRNLKESESYKMLGLTVGRSYRDLRQSR
jgi:hypothetical protein